jgi:leucyl/phenylalanyl-tRNA---protein transferase
VPAFHLNPDYPVFPAVESAEAEPNGLLAVGGYLSANMLLQAYRQAIFPWYDQYSPILWWSPDPREVVQPGHQHWSKSMLKLAKSMDYEITTDRDFASVIAACARQENSDRWITDEMIDAYTELHRIGLAHSLEVWHKQSLVGGLYGVAVGKVFCGESMFHSKTNASKLAFLSLADTLFSKGFALIDCQFETAHLRSLGSHSISRTDYTELLSEARDEEIDWPRTFNPNLS